jgi:hypothetical protein
LILSPKKESKFGSKEPENRQNLSYARGLMSITNIATFPKSSAFATPKMLHPKVGCQVNTDYYGTAVKIAALKLASYLTDPICKVREYFYTFYILNKTCKSTAQKAIKVFLLTLGIVVCSILTPFTTPIGALVRGIVTTVETKPYIYLKREGKGKILPADKKITLVSHNQCYMPAGYSITDGQVTPASDRARMNANIAKIKKLNPDIVCLYEVPDICDAEYISSELPEYPFLIPVVGVSAVGAPSMMYIASKYEIAKDSIQFTPYAKGTELTGRAQYSEKGILSFDITSQGSKTPFATIVSTHLQHSEIPAQPTKEDKKSRAAQMHKIIKLIQEKIKRNGSVIFTGDLNLDETELNAFLDHHRISWLKRDSSVQGQPTWGGDTWCAHLMGKPASGPLVLDYTMVAGKTAAISTQIIGTGYSGPTFKPEATSDHSLLFSTITLQ